MGDQPEPTGGSGTTQESKLRRRVEELEKTMKIVLQGLQKIDDEMADEWGVKVMPEGAVYYDIRF